ncbi:caspase [Fusarium agapanthi]|uniref:Caspase n=1 Tax=Fusarium agapanthi TaxID=1803897 RepID=A0A9P5AYR7_9HYPO|nr:caspase [Fusarium agapanthi]
MAAYESSTDHYAILIGINAYPDRPLTSCVRDVEKIKSLLERQLKGSVDIQTLTSSESLSLDSESTSNAQELHVDWPTCRNVILAFEKVTSKARPGDCVYIHYSGHGTRKKPSFENSNQSTGDLALVLLEGHQSPETYLRGPRLAWLLKAMTDKGLSVTVVLDCCFSASVYRNSAADDNVRFLPDSEADVYADDSMRSVHRDGSMRDNWLLDPDGYTILTACGPHEMAKGGFETKTEKRCGFLSHFLYAALLDHGLNRRHKDIYRHICSVFMVYCVPQNPILYGNGEQGFFGPVVNKGAVRQIYIIKMDGKIKLLAGKAHGILQGDLFTLASSQSAEGRTDDNSVVAEVTTAGPLSSDIALLDAPTGIQTGWVAEPLALSRMQSSRFQLAPDLPCYDDLVTALKRKSLGVQISPCQVQDTQAIQVTTCVGGEYMVFDNSLKDLIKAPILCRGYNAIESICDKMEHLAWFKMVKDLVNQEPTAAFRESVQIQMTQGQQDFGPDEKIDAQHKGPIQLTVRNTGRSDIFAHVYNMGPCGRIMNVFGGTYSHIPPRSGPDDTQEGKCTGVYKARIKMEVPPLLQEYGFCVDIIKVFVTSRATSFEFLERPNLDELEKQESGERISNSPVYLAEDWMAFNFYIQTLI